MRQLFPYIGGKYTIAPEINRRFGAVDTRIDAFAGSSSWILASPPTKYEIVNDLDGYVVNYLRAVKYAPDEVARHLDFPRAELELVARHHYVRDRRRGCPASRRALGGRQRRRSQTAHRGLRLQRRRQRCAVPVCVAAVRLATQRHRSEQKPRVHLVQSALRGRQR